MAAPARVAPAAAAGPAAAAHETPLQAAPDLPSAESVLQHCSAQAGTALGTQAAALDAPFTNKQPTCDACVTYGVRRELWALAPWFC
jgi:hypothetical protein